jgi:hypothetical protein
VLGPDAVWRGTARPLAPGATSVVVGAGRRFQVQAAAGVCVQLSADPGVEEGTLEFRVGGDLDGLLDLPDGGRTAAQVAGRLGVAGSFRAEVRAGDQVLATVACESEPGTGPRPGLWLRVTRQP